MAGQAEKKLKQRAESGSNLYFLISGSVSLIYFIFMIVRKAYVDRLGIWDILSWVFFSGVTFFTYGTIVDSLRLGIEAEYSFDVFVVNLVVQSLSMLTSYAWFLYLCIPFYLVYLGGTWVMNWTASARESEAEFASGAGKKEKKEKVKYKVSKR